MSNIRHPKRASSDVGFSTFVFTLVSILVFILYLYTSIINRPAYKFQTKLHTLSQIISLKESRIKKSVIKEKSEFSWKKIFWNDSNTTKIFSRFSEICIYNFLNANFRTILNWAKIFFIYNFLLLFTIKNYKYKKNCWHFLTKRNFIKFKKKKTENINRFQNFENFLFLLFSDAKPRNCLLLIQTIRLIMLNFHIFVSLEHNPFKNLELKNIFLL